MRCRSGWKTSSCTSRRKGPGRRNFAPLILLLLYAAFSFADSPTTLPRQFLRISKADEKDDSIQVKGHLLDIDGNPVARARIVVEYCDDQHFFPDRREFPTDKDGAFETAIKPGAVLRARLGNAMAV